MSVSLVVHVEINPDRIEEFLKVIEEDAIGSVQREEGCLRFEVLKDESAENKFVFLEGYIDEAAFAAHRETPHFKAWSDFKESGGVISVSVAKCKNLFDGK